MDSRIRGNDKSRHSQFKIYNLKSKISLLLCYTGNGKGKTTAALGAALRAHGQGLRVCVIQFMKNSNTGELHALQQLPGVEIFQSGKGFYQAPDTSVASVLSPAFLSRDSEVSLHSLPAKCAPLPAFSPNCSSNPLISDTQAHKTAAAHALALANEKITTHTCDLLVLDEINIATHLKLLDPNTVISVLKKAPPTLHIILTGRNAPQAFFDLADLVTDMREIKHPFQKGIPAIKGIDF